MSCTRLAIAFIREHYRSNHYAVGQEENVTITRILLNVVLQYSDSSVKRLIGGLTTSSHYSRSVL